MSRRIFVGFLSKKTPTNPMERTSLYDYFSQLPDPRPGRNKKHKFADIIVLSVLAVLCGAVSYDSIEEFGKARAGFL